MNRRIAAVSFATFCCLILVAPGGARAAEPTAAEQAVLDQMSTLHNQALDRLADGKAKQARDILVQAMAAGERAGLGDHPLMARTHLHLAEVYLAGLRNPDRAQVELTNALMIDPELKLPEAGVSTRLRTAFEVARAKVVGTKPAPPPRPPAPAIAVAPPPREPAPSASAGASAEIATASEEVDLADESRPSRAGRFWLGVAAGSGLGYHGDRNLETRPAVLWRAGPAVTARITLTPELGYWYSDTLGFSLFSRHQLIPATGPASPDTTARVRSAHAVFARVHRRLGQLGERLELWGTAAVGAGSVFRLYLPPNATVPAGDTLACGPLALGPGVSLQYRPVPRLAIQADARALLSVWRVAGVVDFSLGTSFYF